MLYVNEDDKFEVSLLGGSTGSEIGTEIGSSNGSLDENDDGTD